MSLLIPGEAKFSMGVSSTTVTTGQEKIDMSLDDLIKSRRNESKSNLRRSSRRRTDPKKPASTLQKAAQNSNRRAEGSRRAHRRANTNFRRGIRDTKSPTKMEVENEIKKKRETQRGRRGTRNNRTVLQRPTKPRPPTKKAIKAAVSAMTSAGFTVPDGMKVVINLEKDKTKSSSTEKKSGNKGTQSKNQSNNNHPNKNNGGRLWNKSNRKH